MMMLLGLTMVLAVVAAGVALAVTKTCGENLPCRGTDNRDVLHERDGRNGNGNGLRDRILALDDKDDVEAATFTNDRDRLDGGKQSDRVLTNDGDTRDSARGGKGSDTCFIDRGDATRSCERIDEAAAGALPAGFDGTTTR
jgi:hypothetical protein